MQCRCASASSGAAIVPAFRTFEHLPRVPCSWKQVVATTSRGMVARGAASTAQGRPSRCPQADCQTAGAQIPRQTASARRNGHLPTTNTKSEPRVYQLCDTLATYECEHVLYVSCEWPCWPSIPVGQTHCHRWGCCCAQHVRSLQCREARNEPHIAIVTVQVYHVHSSCTLRSVSIAILRLDPHNRRVQPAPRLVQLRELAATTAH